MVTASGHWIPEERVPLLAEAVVAFVGKRTQRQRNRAKG